ncbi:MAG TPA: FAD-dependent oxidoreductase [Thermodesulfobacteriota bacterium]|nr:FAD-dependent oxidoreductase [Thermodesulfobacteriota bacterium]
MRKPNMNRRKFLKASAMTGAALIGENLLRGGTQVAYGSKRDEIKRPVERIPVTMEADVVVIGGGPGGFAAALRASRMGASTILIERYDMPGGVHTSGLQGAYNVGVGGIHTELMQRLEKEGHVYTATEKTFPDWAGNPLSHYECSFQPGSSFIRKTFNPEGGGNVMLAMLEEAKVKALYNNTFVDVKMKKPSKKESSIEAVIVKGTAGLRAIKGKVFVDGSGMSEVAARAGAPFVRGGGPQPSTGTAEKQNRPIPGGLLWTMGGIDFEEVSKYQKSQSDPELQKLISTALAAGDIPRELFRPRLEGKCVYGNLYIGHPTLDMNPIGGPGSFIFWENVPYEWALHIDDDPVDEACAKIAMRRFIDAEARFLKKYVPGFKDAFITNVGRYLGIRDGRHPIGEYVLTMEDALNSRTFPDAVTKPMTKNFHWDCYKNHTFQVPYRCFLPQKVNNLLLTGASMSFSYETIFMVMRNFPWCIQTGEIAGYAAASSVKQGISAKEFKWTTPLF